MTASDSDKKLLKAVITNDRQLYEEAFKDVDSLSPSILEEAATSILANVHLKTLDSLHKSAFGTDDVQELLEEYGTRMSPRTLRTIADDASMMGESFEAIVEEAKQALGNIRIDTPEQLQDALMELASKNHILASDFDEIMNMAGNVSLSGEQVMTVLETAIESGNYRMIESIVDHDLLEGVGVSPQQIGAAMIDILETEMLFEENNKGKPVSKEKRLHACQRLTEHADLSDLPPEMAAEIMINVIDIDGSNSPLMDALRDRKVVHAMPVGVLADLVEKVTHYEIPGALEHILTHPQAQEMDREKLGEVLTELAGTDREYNNKAGKEAITILQSSVAKDIPGQYLDEAVIDLVDQGRADDVVGFLKSEGGKKLGLETLNVLSSWANETGHASMRQALVPLKISEEVLKSAVKGVEKVQEKDHEFEKPHGRENQRHNTRPSATR